jgi:uncharacterized protein
MIHRTITESIVARLFKGRIITLRGARRVGKTTLVRALLNQFPDRPTRYLNCDLLPVQQPLSTPDALALKAFLGDQEIVVLDEAQNIPEIGRILKILVDTYPEMQIIATGSSAFDLANQTGAALTGRVYPFELFPLSLTEIAGSHGYSAIEPRLAQLLRFGAYPSILDVSEEEARDQLDELVSNYLYKDVLAYIGIKKSSVVSNLLRLLALQIGKEVAYAELGTALGIDRRTVSNYIDVLEQSFILFRLGAFSRNLRKEIAKGQKIYFYDLGVRNAILQAYAPLELRNDVGEIWENFCIVERHKLLRNRGRRPNQYFWRTYDQREIDYIEEQDGVLTGFECKWNEARRMRQPKDFLTTYPNSVVHQIDRTNYWQYLL